MFRFTVLPGLLAAVLGVVVPTFNRESGKELALNTEMARVSQMMIDLESKRIDADAQMAGAFSSQMASLSEAIAGTKRASDKQIEQLVKLVNATTGAFDQLAEKVDNLQAEIEDTNEEVESEGVGTLDTSKVPESDGRAQDFAELVDQVEQLKRDVADLKRRSGVSSSGVNYPAYEVVGSYSGGSSGGTNSGYRSYQPVSYSQPTVSYSSYPTYSRPSVAAAPAQSSRKVTVRSGLFGLRSRVVDVPSAVAGTCTIDANGHRVCY